MWWGVGGCVMETPFHACGSNGGPCTGNLTRLNTVVMIRMEYFPQTSSRRVFEANSAKFLEDL